MTNHNEDNTKVHIGLFQKLTPIDDMTIDGYEEALDYTFKNPDIHNVALTGSFSSGKSMEKRLYKAKEVAEILQIHMQTAYRLGKQGKIQCIKVGNSVRFVLPEIEGLKMNSERIGK